jgi:hypothetical protein
MPLLDRIKIILRSPRTGNLLPVIINVEHSSLGCKWLAALNHLITNNYHLEKNYCWMGWADGDRTPEYLCEQINDSIAAINSSSLRYTINDHFTVANTVAAEYRLIQDRMNHLHRYFEELQGHAGAMSQHYLAADPAVRWHIRQLNLLCHEYESLILSIRKKYTAPEWQRPSQLMCWLNAPRFELDAQDYKLFGIDTINRSLGGVYVGVNKAVGKHHWEVFHDEGRDSRIDELTTTTLRAQTQAAGDFDIEWARDPGAYHWQIKQLAEFREWLVVNGFDPEDKTLTIGHPRVAQVDLVKTFGTEVHTEIWRQLTDHQDVYKIETDECEATYNYHWSDADFVSRQVKCIQGTNI